jgi:hypothetical protein
MAEPDKRPVTLKNFSSQAPRRPMAVKWWSGHKDSSVHGNVIVTDEMVIKQFREHGWLLPPSERKQQTAVAG